MRISCLLLFLFLGLTGFTCAQNVAETPPQKLYAIKADYRQILTTVVGYRAQCEVKAVAQRFGCDEHVRKMQQIDSQYLWPAIQDAQFAADSGLSVELVTANAIAAAAIVHLESYIVSHHLIGATR